MSQALDKRGSCLVHYPYLVHLKNVKSTIVKSTNCQKCELAKILIAERVITKIRIAKIQGNLDLERAWFIINIRYT